MDRTVDNYQVVYFSGLTGSCRKHGIVLLKLAAKYGTAIFSVWVKPPRSSVVALRFKAGGVECRNGELFIDKILKPSLPIRTALVMFYAFLKSARKPVVLVGHSADSVSGRFLENLQKTQLVDLFHRVIVGFTNAFDIWRINRRDRTSIDDFRLSALSRDFLGVKYSVAEYDTTFLVATLAQLGITISTESQFIENCESYEEAFTKLMNTPERFPIYKGLDRLFSHLPEVVARKMAEAGFSYDSLERVFQEHSSKGLKEFLTPRLIEAHLKVFQMDLSSVEINKIVSNIVAFFEQPKLRWHEVGSSTGGWQGGTGHEARSTLSEPTTSQYQVASGLGPVDQNPAEPTSVLYQILSGANPGYQNLDKQTAYLYQGPSEAGLVYQNPAEPTSFFNQVPSGADPVQENSPESRQNDLEIIQKWYELHGTMY